MKFHKAERVQSREQVIKWIEDAGVSGEKLDALMKDLDISEIYLSDDNKYQVTTFPNTVNGFGTDMLHLSIKRVDREVIHDWRDLQEIKNAFVGPECEAIEVYPAESRLADSANQYHLWCFTNPEVRIPCGFQDRLVSEESIGNSKQRPFKKGATDC